MAALKKALLYSILFFIGVRIVAVAGYWLLPERYAPLGFIANIWKTNYLNWSWANFDGEHYLSIAKYGYQVRNGFPQYAFFPLYPLLIHIFSFFVRDYFFSGLLVTLLSLAAIFWLLPRWLDEVKIKNQLPALLSFVLAPGAVFLASIYTEPFFVAITLAVFYFSEKKKWTLAVLFAALATASRVNGIFVALYLIVRIGQDKKSRGWLPFSLLSFSGIGSFMTYLFFRTGDTLAWFHSQGNWGKSTATSPLVTAASYARAITSEFRPDLTHLVVIFEVVTTLWAAYLIFLIIKNRLLRLPYRLYLLGNLAMPVMTGSLGSMPRFFLVLFPVMVAIPLLSKPTRFIAFTISSILCIAGIILFTRGYWYG